MNDLREALARDADWQRRHRGMSATLCLGFGTATFLVRFCDGEPTSVQGGVGYTQAWDFAIRGATDAWDSLLEATPAPRRQSLFALMKAGDLAIEGDMKRFMQHVWAITRIIEVMRALPAEARHAAH